MKTKIDGLRKWASTRARLASMKSNDEEIGDTVLINETEKQITKTKREKVEDIF